MFDKITGIINLNTSVFLKNIRFNFWKTVKKIKQKYY